MTDHYDILGVARDATPDQIRKAYKTKASAAHPDRRGGDDSAMAAVNAARDCLMDAQRRLRYDATGADEPTDSIEEEAKAALTTIFDEAIESDAPDLVHFVRQKLEITERQLTSGVQNREQRVRILTKRRDRVKAKGATNIAHILIDRKIQTAQAEVAHMKRGVEVMRAARALATDYEYVPEPAPPMQTGVPAWNGAGDAAYFGTLLRNFG